MYQVVTWVCKAEVEQPWNNLEPVYQLAWQGNVAGILYWSLPGIKTLHSALRACYIANHRGAQTTPTILCSGTE